MNDFRKFCAARPAGGYQMIYADPPWSMDLWSRAGEAKSAHAQYDCMPLDEIKALPVGMLAGKDCLL